MFVFLCVFVSISGKKVKDVSFSLSLSLCSRFLCLVCVCNNPVKVKEENR